MLAFLARRLLQSGFVLLGVSVIVFGLLHLTGDPTRLLLPLEAREEDVRQLRTLLGLDDPLWLQYVRFLSRAVRGDFGLSFKHQVPALGLILSTLPATLQLTVAGLSLALVVAVPVGILAALRRNSLLDAVCSVGVLMGQAMPVYWLGLLLILVFAVWLGWFPAAGRDGLRSFVLPACALGAFSMARIARLARSGMLEVLAQDYVRTARSAGVRAFVVTYKYALKNAAIPLVTVIGLEFGILLGGAVITETIFAWPGVGRLAVDAIFSRDYPLVQAIVAVLATLFVLINLAVDLVYTYLDPADRLRAERPVTEAIAVALPAVARARRRRVSFRAVFGITVLLAMGGSALLAPRLAPWDPARQMLLERLRPPAWEARGLREHPLGTDHLGRDILSRILHGGRISLLVGLSAVALAAGLGVTLGLCAGFFGGRADAIIMRIVDVFLAIPYILLAMGVVFALGPSLLNVILVMGATRWVQFARIVRADVLSIREREFVTGARARGNRSGRLLLRHVLPNALTPIIVVATLELAFMIIYESALSFLGLGVQPPTPTWGWMLADGRNYIATAWWLATFPGLAIMLTVLAVNLLGDWLRDTLDPRLKI